MSSRVARATFRFTSANVTPIDNMPKVYESKSPKDRDIMLRKYSRARQHSSSGLQEMDRKLSMWQKANPFRKCYDNDRQRGGEEQDDRMYEIELGEAREEKMENRSEATEVGWFERICQAMMDAGNWVCENIKKILGLFMSVTGTAVAVLFALVFPPSWPVVAGAATIAVVGGVLCYIEFN